MNNFKPNVITCVILCTIFIMAIANTETNKSKEEKKCLNCPHNQIVKELVGVNFKRFAYDSKKHCLVLFYDAWSEDYEKVQKSVYEELAQYYRHSDEIAILRIEYEPFEHFLELEKIEQLPCTRLYRKGRNRAFTYDGIFEIESLKSWLEEKMVEVDPPNDEL